VLGLTARGVKEVKDSPGKSKEGGPPWDHVGNFVATVSSGGWGARVLGQEESQKSAHTRELGEGQIGWGRKTEFNGRGNKRGESKPHNLGGLLYRPVDKSNRAVHQVANELNGASR